MLELMYWGAVREANLKWVGVIMEDSSDSKKARNIMNASTLIRAYHWSR